MPWGSELRLMSRLLLAMALGACADPAPVDPPDGLDAGTAARPDAAGIGRPDAAGAVVDAGDPVENLLAQIDRDVDPAYEIEYRNARFVPPPGQTLLIVGQTLDGIQEHVASFPDQPLPGGWATYWGVVGGEGITDTYTAPQGGRQNHQWVVDTFPNTVIQSAMWMVGTWGVARRTAEGEFDDVLRAFGTWAKAAERPIYLRIGYEFDGPHNELDPQEYIAAYRHVVDLLRAEGVENVAYVWHSYAARTYGGHPVSAWYPGDDYVDWVGISLFGHLYAPEPLPELEAVMAFALAERKPVMVAESTPTLGVSATGDEAWEDWYAALFSFAYERNIKAISVIDEDWTRYSFELGWGDARLQNNPRISAAFFAETNRDRYLRQSRELYETLGYSAE
jgi:hypothetical protein